MTKLKKLKVRDAILLRHITTGKIGCGPHQSRKVYNRRRVKLEAKQALTEN